MTLRRSRVAGFCALALLVHASPAPADSHGPEQVIRALVQANAEKNLPAMAAMMSQDRDAVGYSIGGRKYVGWAEFARDMQLEFEAASRLEIPITELKVWAQGDVAWFTMELDYIRHVRNGHGETHTSLPLRETGVLARRDGRWILVSWHESLREEGLQLAAELSPEPRIRTAQASATAAIDPSGQWEISEEDKTYVATLDRQGNGTYTHQGGRIQTTSLADGQWHGTWQQPGNDREGGFELRLSEDGMEARGVWWYTRVGERANIPPRRHGGTYHWKRLPAAASPPGP